MHIALKHLQGINSEHVGVAKGLPKMGSCSMKPREGQKDDKSDLLHGCLCTRRQSGLEGSGRKQEAHGKNHLVCSNTIRSTARKAIS